MIAALLLLMASSAPPGKLVDVGGYRVHLYCTGAGNPAVMIAGGFSFDWALVQPEAAKFTRVCTYDASGTAWSDPGPEHPTCGSRVEEIHRLIAADGKGRRVLAGFSAGALLTRLYAREHPEDLAGMVIIDHAFLPPKPAASPAIVSGPDSPPVVISATRVNMGVEDEPRYDRLPANVQELQKWAEAVSPGRPDAGMAEECSAEIENATLGSLPLAVGSTANDSPGYAELQKQLLALSSHSRQFIAARSFHSIEISQPDIVIEAIRWVVEATRQ